MRGEMFLVMLALVFVGFGYFNNLDIYFYAAVILAAGSFFWIVQYWRKIEVL